MLNALVQKEEMVTVITCFYYIIEFTEFPRTGTPMLKRQEGYNKGTLTALIST